MRFMQFRPNDVYSYSLSKLEKVSVQLLLTIFPPFKTKVVGSFICSCTLVGDLPSGYTVGIHGKSWSTFECMHILMSSTMVTCTVSKVKQHCQLYLERDIFKMSHSPGIFALKDAFSIHFTDALSCNAALTLIGLG